MDLDYHQQHKANERPRQTIIILCMLCVALLFLTSCANQPPEKSGTVPQETQTQQAATAIATVTLDATDSPTPDPASTPIRPDFDATKFAIMAPPISEQQTVQARQTSFALGTPYPTLSIPTNGPAIVSLGISGCWDAGGPSDYDIANCWAGIPTVEEYLNVFAGATKSDPEQGILMVYTETVATGDSGPKYIYNTPSRSGPVLIANVRWPHMTLITTHPDDDSIPVVTFVFNLQTRTWEEPSQCQLFPIAFSADLLQGLYDHYGTHDANYGTDSRDFGWLTWDGSTITGTLAASLTPPGDSNTYTNPDDPSDHTLSIGDWVLGRPEVEGSNSPAVERAMLDLAIGDDAYSTPSGYVAITVPIWDQAVMEGGSIRYRISDFVWIAVDHYSLAQPNLVSFYYLGHTTCPNAP